MLRFLLLAATLAFAAPWVSVTAEASDTCARATGGNCKPGQKLPPSTGKSGAVTRQKAQAPAKGNHKGRDQYSAAEREKMMERAREICRKNYGAPSRVYKIDYKKNQVWCVPPAY